MAGIKDVLSRLFPKSAAVLRPEPPPLVTGKVDPDTGVLSNEDLNLQTQAALEEISNEAEALRSLVQSPGWRLVEDFIIDSLESDTESLIVAQETQDMIRLQERIKVRQGLLAFINMKILEGSKQEAPDTERVLDVG